MAVHRILIICGIAVMLADFGGCSAANHLAATDPFSDNELLDDPFVTSPQTVGAIERKNSSVAHQQPQESEKTIEQPSIAKSERPNFQQVAHSVEQFEKSTHAHNNASIGTAQVRTAHAETPSGTRPDIQTIHFMPAQPRVPCPVPSEYGAASPPLASQFCPPPGSLPAHEMTSPALYPDEYLFDGGDRSTAASSNPEERMGLQTEDTIAEYKDHLGHNHFKPSNRVAVYSPRFGAVRSISSLEEGVAIAHLAGALDQSRGVGLNSRLSPTTHAQRDALNGLRVRSRASGLDTDMAQTFLDQSTAPSEHVKLINVYQDLAFVRTGIFQQTDEAHLAYGIQAALAWTQDQNPVIAASIESAGEIQSVFRSDAIIGLEEKFKAPGHLRIVKLADKKVAPPGATVTFTIRYDNVGDLPVHDVRITDNLTPRLQYIDDSATSDRPGQIVIEDNQEGSVLLRFELDDSLPGRTGGVITFQARVR